ncbi:MAG: ADOP family duplicated permease, partial [Rhodanobacter sp.]
MRAEMQHHLEEQIRRNEAAGMASPEARYAARRAFGHADRYREQAREARGWLWLEQWWQDLRFAGHLLHKAPGFAVTAILTIAIGIGASAALFSIVNGVLLRPLRFADSEKIVTIVETRPPDGQHIGPAPAVYLDWVEQCTSFSHLGANAFRRFQLRAGERTVGISGLAVTANYLAVFGLEPALGRTFLRQEMTPGRDRVALVSNAVWREHFGGRDDVLGQTITLDDEPFIIVGVLPDHDLVWRAAVVVPLSFGAGAQTDYGSHGGFSTVARLRPSVSLAQAQADLDVVSENIGRAHPESNLGHGAHVEPLLRALTSDVRTQLFILLGAVGFLLLIACVNVASLLLARAHARQREMVVRAALGASPGRLVRQFLSEGLLVCAMGGALGTFGAYVCLGGVVNFAAAYVPRTEEITLDGTVLLLSLGLMVVTGLAVGLPPALLCVRGGLSESLKSSGGCGSGGDSRRRRRLQAVLVVAEIGIATMLLAGTGLLTRSLAALQRADQGFDGSDVQVASFALSGKRYNSSEKILVFWHEAIERTAALPGVEVVAVANGLPSIGGRGLRFQVEGSPAVPVKDAPVAAVALVSPDYFRALGVPFRRGRPFTAQDNAGAPRVIVINETLARQHFPGVDPIGRRIMIMTMADKPDVVREIVGVVGDVRPSGPQSRIGAQIYEPLAQQPVADGTLVVKSKDPSPALSATISDLISSIDPDLPARAVRPYRVVLAGAWFRQRFSATLFALFSGVALLLAAVGIHGVVSYLVSRRTPEIGVRMALGATPRQVLRLVVGDAMRMVWLGLGFGVAGTVVFARALHSLLYQTSPIDPVALAVAGTLLALVALLACWWPARRA